MGRGSCFLWFFYFAFALGRRGCKRVPHVCSHKLNGYTIIKFGRGPMWELSRI